MKKLFLTVAFLLGMTLGAFADWNSQESGWMLFNLFNSNENEQENANVGLFENTEINEMMWNNVIEAPTSMINYDGGGLFGRGKSMSTSVGSGFRGDNFSLLLPNSHGAQGDSEGAPLGSGVVVLLGMGAAYLVGKRKKE